MSRIKLRRNWAMLLGLASSLASLWGGVSWVLGGGMFGVWLTPGLILQPFFGRNIHVIGALTIILAFTSWTVVLFFVLLLLRKFFAANRSGGLNGREREN